MSTKRKNRVFAKTHRRIIAGAGMLALLLFTGCNKLKTKDHMIFSIAAVMPHDGTPVAGVRYRIVEYKYKAKFGKMLGEPSPTGWELHGLTDNYGKASGNFKGVIKINYEYRIYFDYTNMVLPAEISDYIIKGPEYDILRRSAPQDNFYTIGIIPYMPVQFKFMNAACVDHNDIFRYKSKNIEDKPYSNFDAYPWLEGPTLNGCVNLEGDYLNRLAGHYVFKWEAIRGDVLSEGMDTFYVSPGGNAIVNMEW